VGDPLEGWIAIADLVNRSESWCREAAARAGDLRLPVFWLGGRTGTRGTPCLLRADHAAWLMRCRDAGRQANEQP
jgi:hypothetical protein